MGHFTINISKATELSVATDKMFATHVSLRCFCDFYDFSLVCKILYKTKVFRILRTFASSLSSKLPLPNKRRLSGVTNFTIFATKSQPLRLSSVFVEFDVFGVLSPSPSAWKRTLQIFEFCIKFFTFVKFVVLVRVLGAFSAASSAKIL